tara:strand:- start:80 stop:1012 length:933 start_codon:yes stop_codon:yes gene_type:complete
MMIRLIIILIGFNFADYLGGFAGSSFRYSTNARDMALGNTLISEYNEGFNAFSNPALLSAITENEIGVSQFSMSLDRYIQAFSFSQNLSDNAGASISFFNSGVSNIDGRDLYNESTGKFASNEGYLMLSFGAKLNQKMDIGLNIKTIFNEIDQYSAKGISADIGLIYNFSDEVTISMIMDDILGEYSWEGLSETSGSFKESLPTVSSLGVSYKINDSIKALSKIDYVNPDGLNLFRLSSGLEVDRGLYVLRVGAIQSNGVNNESFKTKFLIGAGVNVGVLRGRVVRLDYCIDFGQENEGISNLFSLSFIK